MYHGEVDPVIAKGLEVLKKRIKDAAIPASQLDESLNLATWNIRAFGKTYDRRRRSRAAVHYIAEILSQFDLIAITELTDNLSDLQKVMDVLGPYWHVVFSDFSTDPAGNRERMAYLYDGRAVVFTGLAAEADEPRKKDRVTKEYIPTMTWWRSPYMASFRSGRFDFMLLTAHIRWASNDHDVRIPILKKTAEWVHKRRREKYVIDKDIILLGDFNIPAVGDDLYKALTSKGLTMPAAFAGEHPGSNLAKVSHYDQILHYPRSGDTSTETAGVLDFFRDDWRALFPADEFPWLDSKRKFTYQLSDHLPLWIQLDISESSGTLDHSFSH